MRRALIKIGIVVIALVVVGAVGYGVVHARSGGGGTGQPVASPTPGATGTSAARPTAAPVPRWQVAKAVGTVVAYRAPSTAAAVRQRFNKVNANGFPSVFLVRSVRQVGDTTWYDVWLPIRPNESHGWVREGSVAIYTTTAKIVIHLSQRRLLVYRRGVLVGTFPVAVGMSQLPTPTGIYFVNQKLRPPTLGGPYGVLALGISAYQPRLPSWPQGGPVAIHGTNEDSLIGQAVSHGCVRMHNADVLKVSALVPTGSPVSWAPRLRGRCLPVLALDELHVFGPALGTGVRVGLLQEEELAATGETVELVHEDVGAGQVDLGERLALHADGRHEALARIVGADSPADLVRRIAALAADEGRVLSHARSPSFRSTT